MMKTRTMLIQGGTKVKQAVKMSLAISIIAVMMACQGNSANNENSPANANTSANSTANTGDKKAIVDEIKEVLAQHDKALSEKNLDNVMATFSTGPNTVVLGTGAEEKWVGTEAIKAAYTEMFKDYDPGTLQSSCEWKTGGADDAKTMAWLAAICSAKDSLQGKARQYQLNVTATLQKQDGKWHFVSLHMSNAFQPPVTK
jgi:ketosteroid isomerase-like protein